MNLLAKTRLLTALLILPAAIGCTGESGGRDPQLIPEDRFTTDAVVTDYFTKQLDRMTIEMPPEQMSREVISAQVSAIERAKQQIWTLWKEANQARLATCGISEAMPIDKPVWTLPNGDKMKFATFAKGTKPVGGYPMIIHLHGGGKYPDTPIPWGSGVNEDEWYQSLRLSAGYKDAPCLCFVPRMPDDRKGRWYHMPLTFVYRRAYQLGVLSGLVDPDRFYITGISEGGYGTVRVGPFMPDYFAAVGCLAAAAKPTDALRGLRNTPFRMEVGEDDTMYGRNVYVRLCQDRLNELATQNSGSYPHEVIIQKGRGHHINYYGMTPWLITHKRNARPNHVTYVYHSIVPDESDAMEAFSDGVYCLDLRALRPDSKDTRLSIDLVKKDNAYTLTTEPLYGKVTGKIGLYIADVDYTEPITVLYNGKTVFRGKLFPNRGAMVDAVALFGDPRRIFSSKLAIDL